MEVATAEFTTVGAGKHRRPSAPAAPRLDRSQPHPPSSAPPPPPSPPPPPPSPPPPPPAIPPPTPAVALPRTNAHARVSRASH
eukprot:244729-Prymnesium_polylepis.2